MTEAMRLLFGWVSFAPSFFIVIIARWDKVVASCFKVVEISNSLIVSEVSLLGTTTVEKFLRLVSLLHTIQHTQSFFYGYAHAVRVAYFNFHPHMATRFLHRLCQRTVLTYIVSIPYLPSGGLS